MRAVDPSAYREPPGRLRWRWYDLLPVLAGVATAILFPGLRWWEVALGGTVLWALWFLGRSWWHRRRRRASPPVR